MLASRNTSAAADANCFIKFNPLASFQSAHWTGFDTAFALSAAGAAGALAVLPAAFFIINFDRHSLKEKAVV